MGRFKAKPPRKGYSSPTIEINRHGREWRDVYPSDLDIGDTLANMGLVVELGLITCRRELVVEAGVPDTKQYLLPMNEKVKAFVKKG